MAIKNVSDKFKEVELGNTSSFSLDDAFDAVEELRPLRCLLLGCQGSGKSSFAGTSGLKTLVLTGTNETHGGINAKVHAKRMNTGGQVSSVSYVTHNGELRSADESIKFLLSTLSGKEIQKNKVTVVVIESMNDVTELFRKTNECKSASMEKGVFSTWRERDVVANFINRLIDSTTELTLAGVHVIFTLACQVSVANGMETVSPSLEINDVVKLLSQKFDEVLYMENNEETRCLVFDETNIGKTTLEKEKGSDKTSPKIRSRINFSPRVSYMLELPERIENPTLKQLLKDREESFNKLFK